jgi:hypothetical protein
MPNSLDAMNLASEMRSWPVDALHAVWMEMRERVAPYPRWLLMLRKPGRRDLHIYDAVAFEIKRREMAQRAMAQRAMAQREVIGNLVL